MTWVNAALKVDENALDIWTHAKVMLSLKRASKHRPGGPWDDDDYDVFDGEQHVGRILWTHAASKDTPWFWTITARVPNTIYDRGYATSRSRR